MTNLETQLAEALQRAIELTKKTDNGDASFRKTYDALLCMQAAVPYWEDLITEYNRQLSHPGAQY